MYSVALQPKGLYVCYVVDEALLTLTLPESWLGSNSCQEQLDWR